MRELSERQLVLLIGGMQFVNVLGFMMVIPLGPDFALALGFATSEIGLVSGVYAFTSAFASLLAAGFLDRFERRNAVTVAITNLTLDSMSAALAWNLQSLLVARVVAGIFAASAHSLSMAVLIDRIPEARRGRALGAVMGSFSLASIFGVPAGLEIARWGGWQWPFLCVGLLGLLSAGLARCFLPTMSCEARANQSRLRLTELFRRSDALLGFFVAGIAIFGNFLLVPSLSAFVQFNLHYPREHLGLLYLLGGGISFFTMRLIGRWNDRYGSFPPALAAVLLLTLVLVTGFMSEPALLPVLVLFPLFMVANTSRHVSVTTLVSKVPQAHERAGFMAVVAALQHLFLGVGAIASTYLLDATPTGALIGVPRAAMVTLLSAYLLLPAIAWLERRLRKRAADMATGSSAGMP